MSDKKGYLVLHAYELKKLNEMMYAVSSIICDLDIIEDSTYDVQGEKLVKFRECFFKKEYKGDLDD